MRFIFPILSRAASVVAVFAGAATITHGLDALIASGVWFILAVLLSIGGREDRQKSGG
jgi:hypothetical protein